MFVILYSCLMNILFYSIQFFVNSEMTINYSLIIHLPIIYECYYNI